MLIALILLLILAQPAGAETFKIGIATSKAAVECDWYVWDRRDKFWGWATVYSHSGVLRGKYFIIPSGKQYAEAVAAGEEVYIPSNLHPTTPFEIMLAGGIKPLPPESEVPRIAPEDM